MKMQRLKDFFLRKLKKLENFCKAWKKAMWFAGTVTTLLMFFVSWYFVVPYVLFWLLYGIGYEIPQGFYHFLKKKLGRIP